jgi:hypothetical protein
VVERWAKNWTIGVGNYSFHHRVQTGSGAHMGTRMLKAFLEHFSLLE